MALGILVLAVLAVVGLPAVWSKVGWIVAGVGAALALLDK